MIRAIIKGPNPLLFQPSAPVDLDNAEHQQAIVDLCDTMLDTPRALGLAAVQIGVPLRFFGMRLRMGIHVFANPIVLKEAAIWHTAEEECMSFPGLKVKVSRAASVRLQWTEPKSREHHEGWLNGREARCAQHEIDHLNGITLEQHRRRA